MKGNNQAYKLWLCLLCSFILLPLEIQAQEKGDSITGKVHKIDEVTVTAERTKQQVKSSSPFQQLNKKQLQQQGITDIADALRRFSGVNRLWGCRRNENYLRSEFRSQTYSRSL